MRATETPRTILVVEDNELILRIFHDLLEAHGYKVLQTRSGLEAVKLARQHRPDLILMDIQLPEVSGLEITKWIKADDDLRSVPIVAVTALAMQGEEAAIRQAGCEGYLAKPVSMARFMGTIEQFLGRAADGAPSARPSAGA